MEIVNCKIVFNVTEVAKIIGVPVEEWKGNCHGISSLLLEHKLVVGKLRYGHWIGPVREKTLFSKYPRGIVRHGWVELENGTIVDPRRYIFEGVEPYIYVGKNDHYDAGGNRFRQSLMKPAPKYSKDERQVTLKIRRIVARKILEDMLDTTSHFGVIYATIKQVFWLANLPLDTFSGFAKPIYEAIMEVGYGAFIPIDNKTMVMEEPQILLIKSIDNVKQRKGVSNRK